MSNQKTNLYIFGVSTTAKAVFTFINNYKLFNVKGFVIDAAFKQNDTFCGLPVLGVDSDLRIDNFDKEQDFLFVAIQWNNLNEDRRAVYCRFSTAGYRFANVIAPTAVVHGELLGDNCWVSDFAVIDTNTTIGANTFIKTKAFIGNDCTIGDHCFIGASSFIAGDCILGEQNFIGVRATIFDNVQIGRMNILGACTVIKRNVGDFTLIKSNNDQVVKRYDEKSIVLKLNHKANKR